MTDLDALLLRCGRELSIRRVLALRIAARSAADFPGCALLSHVVCLPATVLARHGTSFVWQAAQRFIGEAGEERAEALTVCCFDAYYSCLPVGVTLGVRKLTLLPTIGALVSGTAKISTAESADGPGSVSRASHLSADRHPQYDVLKEISPTLTVLSMPTDDLFDTVSNRYASRGGAGQFAEIIQDGLALIRSTSPCFGQDVLRDVRWMVKVDSPSPDVHRSFSTDSLDDVIFLSQPQANKSRSAQIIAEAIVHESGHLRLHRIMGLFSLHTLSDTERFYSPWRDDARPLSGLLHGLYVLARLCEFYGTALQSGRLVDDTGTLDFFVQRLSWCQISATVGLLQIPTASLTAEGLIVVEYIRKATMTDGRDPEPTAVAAATTHIDLWRERNGAHSSGLKIPQWP